VASAHRACPAAAAGAGEIAAIPDVALEPLSPATRARCAALAMRDDQRRFVAPVAD
jgi:hypothetical protein